MNIEALVLSHDATDLLSGCGLPVADLSLPSSHCFFGIREEGELIAMVGLELYSQHALLRSLAVKPAYQGRGLGRKLVAFAESFAASKGVEFLYLLTSTAAPFFLGLGFTAAARETAPSAIRATSQFAGLCPASSAFLCKRLA